MSGEHSFCGFVVLARQQVLKTGIRRLEGRMHSSGIAPDDEMANVNEDSATTTRQPGWLLGVAGDAVGEWCSSTSRSGRAPSHRR
jgi:hypothetical protein